MEEKQGSTLVFEHAMLNLCICERTARAYARHAREVEDATGGISARDFIRFLNLEYDKGQVASRCASTMRGYKSALLHEGRMRGSEMSSAESMYIDKLLDGFEVFKGPRKHRGGFTRSMLRQVCRLAENMQEFDVADGLALLDGAVLRPRDIEHMTLDTVSKDGTWVYAELKLPRPAKMRAGTVEIRPVLTPLARQILISRVRAFKNCPNAPMFPRWSEAGRIVKLAAIEFGWPDDVLWTGAHNARHGGAQRVLDEALERVAEAGGWRGHEGPRRYSIRSRMGRGQAIRAMAQRRKARRG